MKRDDEECNVEWLASDTEKIRREKEIR